MSDLKILIVEDDLFYQTYVNDLLRGSDMKIVNANDGEEALLFARSEKPDLILTDVEIPKVQGFVLLNQLKEMPETSHIPVIMMSGKVEKDLFEKHAQLSVHAEDYLLKPFSRSELLDTISKVMGQTALEEASGTASNQETEEKTAIWAGNEPRQNESRPRALVVDDSSYVRDLSRDLLTEVGLEVEVAADGEEGLEKAREIMPDVVLLDVQMPRANGFVVCEALKRDELTKSIPIILMSAVLDSESFEKHAEFQYRADAYLQKPFKKEELWRLVSEHVARASTASAVQRKTDFTVPEGKGKSDVAERIAEPGDAVETIETLREREKLYLAELERFRREKDQQLEDTRQERRQSEYRRSRLVEKLTLATRRAEEAGKETEELERRNRRLQMDLEAALTAKGEIEDQARSIVENLNTGASVEDYHEELKELRKESIETAARLADAQAQMGQLEKTEGELERVRSENRQMKEALAISTDRADLADRINGLKDQLSQAEEKAGTVKKEKEQLRISLDSVMEQNSRLAEKAEEAQSNLNEFRLECERLRSDVQSLHSERAESEKRILELERKLEESVKDLSRKIETEKEARSIAEKEAQFARKELQGAEEDRKRAASLKRELEKTSRDLEGVQAQFRVLEKENKLLENRLKKDLEAGAGPDRGAGGATETGDRENLLAARLDQLEDTLKRTMLDAQSALADQQGKEEKLEGEMRTLLGTLEAEREEHRRERERWRAREDDIKESMEEFFEERRRIMGEEISRFYPTPVTRTTRPLEVVTGRRRIGFLAALSLLFIIAFLLGFLVISRVATGQSFFQENRHRIGTSLAIKPHLQENGWVSPDVYRGGPL